MDTRNTWWIFGLLQHLHMLQRAHCVFATKTDMAWTEGFSKCQMANKVEVDRHSKRYRAWVGALSVYTPWMVHEGCFGQAKTIDIKRTSFVDNSPSRCSYHCRTHKYFAVMGNLCRCAQMIRSVSKENIPRCNSLCSSTQDKCGSRDSKYANLYRHITGNYKPHTDFFELDPRDEKVCSVLVVVKNTFRLEAEHCWKSHKALCEQNENGLSSMDYKTAKHRCHLTGHFENDTISKFKLSSGKYWTGIHRVRIIRWLGRDTMKDICNEFGNFEKVKCILVDYKSAMHISKIPTSCMECHPVLCSYTKKPAIKANYTWTECREDSQPTILPVMTSMTDKNSTPTTMEMSGSTKVQSYPICPNRKSSKSIVMQTTTQPFALIREPTTEKKAPSSNISRPTGVTDVPRNLHWPFLTGIISLAPLIIIAVILITLFAFYRSRKRSKLSRNETTEIPGLVYDICQDQTQYHHLGFQSRQDDFPRFAGGPVYDVNAVNGCSQGTSYEMTANSLLLNTVNHQHNTDGEPTFENSLQASPFPKNKEEYCGNRICHSQFLYDTPTEID